MGYVDRIPLLLEPPAEETRHLQLVFDHQDAHILRLASSDENGMRGQRSSIPRSTGFTSSSGVPSRASRLLTGIRRPSNGQDIHPVQTYWVRAGRGPVLSTPCSGRVTSFLGWTTRTPPGGPVEPGQQNHLVAHCKVA